MDNIESHRQRISQYAASRQVPIEKDPVRWNRAPQFRHGLELVDSTDVLDKLLTDLLTGKRRNPSKDRDKLRDLSFLIANLMDAPGHIIHLSMNRNSWSASTYRTAGHFAREAVKLLADRGLIGKKDGSEAAHRHTRIWATPELLEMFAGLNTEYTPPQFAVLKDANGDLVEYKNTPPAIRRVVAILKRNHEICRRTDVKGVVRDKIQRVNTSLHAVFLRNWETYGRMHTSTWRGYQGVKKKDRPAITINGEPSIERDFSGLHPRMLYARVGVQYDDDPYTSVNAHPDLRGFLKVLLLALVNSDSLRKAVYAGNFEVWDQCQHEDYKLYQLLRHLGLRTSDLIQDFMEAHPKIASFFGKPGLGLELMHADSKMALDVIDTFNRHEIPVLSIHDSFIVPREFDNILYETMDEVYQRHTGFKCPIK